METIGRRIAEALERRNLNQRELASKVGRSKSLISQWISGSKNIDAKDLYRVAVALDMPIEFFYPEVVPLHSLDKYGEILGITDAGEFEIITLRRRKRP